ncbi:hypothetical protein [Lacimicrobium sp. SS2-24]|uniref:hypothetical protein n=1 Tax=Lacimicrobium sp. SS2-24 TaxID=2005569 RepID=UPI000B4C194C|nr:hypothetical protein [Lacimicrobium sp. SS2-24]
MVHKCSRLALLSVLFICVPIAHAQTPLNAQQRVEASLQDEPFYQQVLKASALMPADTTDTNLGCEIRGGAPVPEYATATQSQLNQPDWESRIRADWDFFKGTEENTRLLVIDYRMQESQLAYRYLANRQSQNQLYEPWSTSKVMAITAAISAARAQGVGAQSLAGGVVPVADLITSIHTYTPFGGADGNSNAIATYLVNAAGRDYITGLFQGNWLKLNDARIGLRGGYYVEIFNPGAPFWSDPVSGKKAAMPVLTANTADPGYRSYRCDACALTGNKPMTTLAQAEWLKRLAVHGRDNVSPHPNLTPSDVRTLFYGMGHSDAKSEHGGMIAGISRLIPHAISRALGGNEDNAKVLLDELNQGKWRIFQKLGWGPSGTRGMSEVAMLAHVCLPGVQGGREFTLAAQAAVEGDAEIRVNDAAKKIQTLLTSGMHALLNQPVARQ